MATLVLSAAGAAIGGSFGGTLLGLSGAVIGKAVGATLGSFLDQKLLGGGSDPVEVGRVTSLRGQGSSEGAALPRLAGRMRVGGQVIWSTRFKETVTTSGGSGKGIGGSGPEVREFSYSVSLAVALCEGPVTRIGRVWADGKPFALERTVYRLYPGHEAQGPDPLIDLIEGSGNAPAFRGVAYLVFENLAVGEFGNRIPQFNVEVFRQPPALPGSAEPSLRTVLRGVALTPGTGEYALSPDPVSYRAGKGARRVANVNNLSGETDMVASLGQLNAELPACDAVSVVVSWFGTDLRCGLCRAEPRVEQGAEDAVEQPWVVSGVGRGAAARVSRSDGRPNYGGTPSDASVLAAIRRLKAEGKRVTFYPFLLMDVPPGNGLADPWTGAAAQPAFPWRGRITLSQAPGRPGSPDRTAAAGAEVAAFFGTATAAQVVASGDAVGFTGGADWGFRRFILHYARLCAVAGGVEAFLIGSEMRGLTQIRDAAGYPAVTALRALAAEVRAILGPGVKLGYAADWSEYFGHQPGDGSGDVMFHLDPLWADPVIDFVGIDNYMPLSDWRDGAGHLDAAAGSIYSLDYLKGNVAGGEGFDWYYAGEADRQAQRRTPIRDTAHGEDWVFRVKDLVGWWSNRHRNRPGGVRAATPTAWTPRMKPIWFTEIGCPAVDKGTNQPNVFVDPKSSETALPWFSSGVRDDFIQRRYLQATYAWWGDPANNPVSPVYGGPMVDLAHTFVWAWDARPWPDFPGREDVWSDGPNHRLGHWISGRLGSAGLAETVAEICRGAGVTAVDVTGLTGLVAGYLLDAPQTARAALQPLMLAHGFDAVERDGRIVFRMRGGGADHDLTDAPFALSEESGATGVSLSRAPRAEVPEAVQITYIEADNDYQRAAAEATHPEAALPRADRSEVPIAMAAPEAQEVAERWLAEARIARDQAVFALPPSLLRVEPGDIVRLGSGREEALYRIDTVEEAGARRVEARRVEPGIHGMIGAVAPAYARAPVPYAGGVDVTLLDLPLLGGDEVAHAPWIAASGQPWPGPVAVWLSASDAGYRLDRVLRRPAVTGETLTALAASRPWLWSRGPGVVLRVTGGALAARSALDVLNGANALALRAAGAEDWEVIQFRDVELVGAETYRVSGILRGQSGTDFLAGAEVPAGAEVVLLGSGAEQIGLAQADRGLSRHLRIGPARLSYDDPAYVHVEAAFAGVGLRPYAPVHLRARRQAGGGVSLTWVRRTRRDGDSWAGSEVPLAEEDERYEVRIRSGGGLRRVIEVTAPAATYTPAEQAADGATAPFAIDVAQISASFGAGPSRRITVDG